MLSTRSPGRLLLSAILLFGLGAAAGVLTTPQHAQASLCSDTVCHPNQVMNCWSGWIGSNCWPAFDSCRTIPCL